MVNYIKKTRSILRNFLIAIITPIHFSIYTGHFLSSLLGKAVSAKGKPILWFTFPAIDFLTSKDFSSSDILEFGGGQSTLFWLSKAKSVTTFETDIMWKNKIEKLSNGDSKLNLLFTPDNHNQIDYVNNFLKKNQRSFDIIVIDGMDRSSLFSLAVDYVTDDGMIICDNAEGYDFYKAWQEHPSFMRIDFSGHGPGILHPHTTSILFKKNCKFTNIVNPIFIQKYKYKKI